MANPWADRGVGRYVAPVAVAFVCAAAAVATASSLRRPLEIDETVSFWIADRSSLGTLLDRSLRYSATPPLSFVCQRALLDAFGRNELMLRIPAWASYLGAVVAVAFLGGRWLNPTAGALAALLLALHPMAQKFAVQGRPYTLGLLLAIGAVGATEALGRAGFHWRRLAPWFVLNLALLYTHYLFVLLWVAEFVWLSLAARRGTVRLANVVIWFGGLGLAALPLRAAVMHVWRHREFLNWNPYPPPWTDLAGPLLPFHWTRASQPVPWILLAVSLAWQVTVYGIRPRNWFIAERLRACANVTLHAVVWTLGPVVGLALLGRFWLPSLATDRYMLIYVPCGVVWIAGLLSSLRGRIVPGLLLLAIVWLAVDFGGVRAAYDRWRSGENGQLANGRSTSVDQRWKDVAKSLSAVDSHDRVFVGTGLTEMTLVPVYFGDPVFQDYATCRLSRIYFGQDAERLALPMSWTRDLALAYQRRPPATRSDQAAPAAAPRSIWLIAATDTDRLVATAEQARRLIKSWGWLESSLDHHAGVLVARYVPPEARDIER